MQARSQSFEVASTTSREPLEQLLRSVESALRSIHGKDGSLSLTVSTDTGTLSVDMRSKSRETLVAELMMTLASLRLQQSLGMLLLDSSSSYATQEK